MPSEVAHRVDTEDGYPVVQLAGVLNEDAGPGVRSALLAVLADQPEAVVVDVSDLRLADTQAGAVLREVAGDNADWPAAHIVLSAGRDSSGWLFTGLPVWRDRAEALADLGAPDPQLRMTVDLEPVVGAARRARELVTEACARWDTPELAGPACIVVTEMVNNVVAHARTPMTVLVARQGDGMSVAVRDYSPTAPRFTGEPVPPTSHGGRGLLLIDSVSSRWGHLDVPGGKVVWALLHDEKDEPRPAVGVGDRAGMRGRYRG
ncbi:MAG TPA: ATP-binding protein [Actinoplanes sp.]|nr:ATP-binding protein [Actinoplanes sp.]